MTTRERAEDLVIRFNEPTMDKTNYRVQAMINMTEEAINAAVEEEREACAKAADGFLTSGDSHAAQLIGNNIRARRNSGGTK